MLYLMNSKNKLAKRDLCLTYSLRNNTAYPPNIESMARYLSTKYPNNKPAHQHGGEKGDKRKDNDLKDSDKDIDKGGTVSVHVEDTTTTEESPAPRGGPSIGAHISETNVQLSRSLCTVEEILGVHPMNDDDFWNNTNPTDVSIDTTNNKEMMAEAISQKYTHTQRTRSN